MLSSLLLGGVLSCGQTPMQLPSNMPATQPTPAPVIIQQPIELPAAPEAPADQPEEKTPFMSILAGTGVGNFLDRTGIKIYGHTNASFTASSATNFNLPLVMNYKANEFLLQQNYLKIERAVDTESDTPSLGFTSHTILPGTDGRFTVIRGLYDRQLIENNGLPQEYLIDPVQFYLEAFLPNLLGGTSIKAGRFFTLVGQESIDASANFFGSRSYNFQWNPFTHTGVLATSPLGDNFSISYGVATGTDIFFTNASNATFLGQLKWAPKDGDTSLAFNVVFGRGKADPFNNWFNNINVFNLLLTRKVSDKLNYVLDVTGSYQRDIPGIGQAAWYGFANYLFYNLSEKLGLGLRGEVFHDVEGFRTGTKGLYSAGTFGLNWRVFDNVLFRPEVRYDHNSDNPAFEGKKGLFTANFDVLLSW